MNTGQSAPKRLILPDADRARLTHYLFRYPAKFHPPVVAALIQGFTLPGNRILDPFVGSGTTLVEAAKAGRTAVGIDVDPVAVEVSLGKTRKYNLKAVDKALASLTDRIAKWERPGIEYQELMFSDITEEQFEKAVANDGLWVPEIPRLHHWFRRYVTVDLARILTEISGLKTDARTKLLLRIIFASIIRNSSNADPVPVSGLEYTSHMKKRDAAGRLVNPFALMRSAMAKSRQAVAEYVGLLPEDVDEPRAVRGDATQISKRTVGQFDAVITSPPYHNAVDYYRRHQLEMFWLGHTENQVEREQLLPRYIGRPRVAARDPLLSLPWSPPPLTQEWEQRMAAVSASRAADFRHYAQAMTKSFASLARVLKPSAPMIMVVGHSSWNGEEIPTGTIFAELAQDFELRETLHYPIKNRYMSYSRRNEASIDEEFVLVFVRKPVEPSPGPS